MASFILNEDAARDWVISLIMANELADLDTSVAVALEKIPQLSLDWRPWEPGQEDAVAALIGCANHQPGVLARPEHADVAIELVDDGDDWCYHFLLRINAPAPVTLASRSREVRRLGDKSTFGVGAALGILRESAQAADALLEQLNAFVKAIIRET